MIVSRWVPLFLICSLPVAIPVVQSEPLSKKSMFSASQPISHSAESVHKYANGDWYKGVLVHGKKTGKGVYGWANGHHYEGDFVNDRQTGKGVFTWANRDQYRGDFVDGKPSGKGVFIWANGDHYEGDVVEIVPADMKRDQFAHKHIDDTVYMSGKSGVMIFANGRREKGVVINGQFKNAIE
ncbi:MAG: hypothetical protein V4525_10395 [Pseudomonadota bacterium]